MKHYSLLLAQLLLISAHLFAQSDSVAQKQAPETSQKGKNKKSKILLEKELLKEHYQLLPASMCLANFNPAGWNDNFIERVSDREYFGRTTDSLQNVPDQMPMFPDGLDGLYFYVYHYLVYPEEARRKKISGRVIMAVDVDETGEIANVREVKTEHPSFARAAEEALYDMPKLFPAKKSGSFIPIRIYVPIAFSIN